jgi:hypothetical protein
MEWHRNVTHSLVMLPLWAVLLAALSLPLARWLRWKAPTFPMLFVIYAVGLATHVFLDVVTSFGTMVWSPLRYSRVAWDWLFIVDLTLTALALVPQLAAWCYREPHKFEARAGAVWAALTVGAFGGYALVASVGYGFAIWAVGAISAILAMVLFGPAMRGRGFKWKRSTWCRAGLALVGAYLALASGTHRKALADVDAFAAARHLPSGNRAAIPLPPTLTHWAGVISTPEGVWRATIREPGGVIERTHLYSDAQSDPHVREAEKVRDVQVYLWFARFPIWLVRQREGQTIVEVSDVRFFREEDPNADSENQQSARSFGIRPNAPGFTFQIVFDVNGHVVSSGFKKPDE